MGILGLGGETFASQLNAFVIDIGKISTKDLKPEEVKTALQNALSKVGDDMAKFAISDLKDFQNAGEGALETLTRLANEYQTVDVVLKSFGKTFGEVGFGSMAARERLVELAGGLDKFTAQGQFFLENFFSEQEQADALRARIAPTLAKYGLSTEGENAVRMFRNVVVGLDTTTKSGAEAYSALMAIAPAFKSVIDAADDVLSERKPVRDGPPPVSAAFTEEPVIAPPLGVEPSTWSELLYQYMKTFNTQRCAPVYALTM